MPLGGRRSALKASERLQAALGAIEPRRTSDGPPARPSRTGYCCLRLSIELHYWQLAMSNVSRITAVWSGFSGAPGYSKFSFIPLADDTARNAAGAAVRAFLAAVATYIPSGTTIQIQPTVDDLDIISGELMSSATMTTVPSTVTSSAGVTAYAAGSGFVVTWGATGVFNGRRIRGRTFIVPAVNCFESDGTLVSTVISAVQSAGNTLIGATGADLAVWNRSWTKTKPTTPVSGILSSTTSCTVRDAASQLRSRRT